MASIRCHDHGIGYTKPPAVSPSDNLAPTMCNQNISSRPPQEWAKIMIVAVNGSASSLQPHKLQSACQSADRTTWKLVRISIAQLKGGERAGSTRPVGPGCTYPRLVGSATHESTHSDGLERSALARTRRSRDYRVL